VIQHGPLSNRIYLMSLDVQDCPGIVDRLDVLAEKNGYTKIFAKVPGSVKGRFLRCGYDEEAAVPGFFGGAQEGEEGAFLAKYLCKDRERDPDPEALRNVVHTALRKGQSARPPAPLPEGLALAPLGPGEAETMAALYARVFVSYPFPIHDPGYIRQTMDEGAAYHGVRQGDRLIGLASAEPDFEAGNAEMTDFAVLPKYRGMALARHLLPALEGRMARRAVQTFYTIARARSYGMNVTFARQGYQYVGTLTNNTNISGAVESMNVWFRHAS